MSTSKPLTTSEVTQALRERYCPKSSVRVADRWAFIQEARNDAGHKASRSCDAIAMGLWPSEGLRLHGHEIKVSRGDWLKELNDPSKSDAFSRYMHYWWVVAPKGVVVLDELPATWGLMVVGSSRSIKVQRPATLNKKPEMITYGFLASLLRRSLEQDEVTAMVRKAKEEGYRDAQTKFDSRAKEIEARITRQERDRQGDAVAAVERFEAASGVKLNAWNAKRIGEAVSILEKLDPRLAIRQMTGLSDAASRLANSLQTVFRVDTSD